NIVTIYGAGESEDLLWIAMRYVQGTDLRRLLKAEGRLDLERTISITSQVARALDAAHVRGLIHRDIKPANILMIEDRRRFKDEVYLTDFGLTKKASEESGITQTGQFLGTIDYIPPEQIQGGAVSGLADQYSLGCVIFESLTGHVPYIKETEVA